LILLALYLFPIAIAAPIIQFKPLPLEYFKSKPLIIETVVLTLGPLPYPWRIGDDRSAPGFQDQQGTPNDLQEIRSWSQDLERFPGLCRSAQRLFIFASAALRQVYLANDAVSEEQYPTSLLLVFGAYYSLLIALIFAACYTIPCSARERLLNGLLSFACPWQRSMEQTYAKRKELEDFLELKIAPDATTAATITLLAPLVSVSCPPW